RLRGQKRNRLVLVSSRPDLVRAAAQRGKKRPKVAEIAVGYGQPLPEQGELGVLVVLRLPAELRRDLGDPALEAPTLGLERERSCIPGRQRVLDGVEGRRVLAIRRSFKQVADLVAHHQLSTPVPGPLA